MKKTLLAVILAAMATAASAEGNYAGVRAELRNGTNGTEDAAAYSLTAGQNINQNLDGEISVRVKSNDNDSNNTRMEGALIAKTQYGDFTPYVRGAIGEKFDGTDNFAYWSVEPGVKYAVLSDLSVKAGIRFRDAFNTGDNDSTRTYRLGADYAVTKASTVSLGVDLQRGDSDYNTISAGYSVKF